MTAPVGRVFLSRRVSGSCFEAMASHPVARQCAAPSYAAPSYAAPSYATPSYAAPSYAAPSYAAPSCAAPSCAAPGRVPEQVVCARQVVLHLQSLTEPAVVKRLISQQTKAGARPRPKSVPALSRV